jgi:hypothetical protein
MSYAKSARNFIIEFCPIENRNYKFIVVKTLIDRNLEIVFQSSVF